MSSDCRTLFYSVAKCWLTRISPCGDRGESILSIKTLSRTVPQSGRSRTLADAKIGQKPGSSCSMNRSWLTTSPTSRGAGPGGVAGDRRALAPAARLSNCQSCSTRPLPPPSRSSSGEVGRVPAVAVRHEVVLGALQGARRREQAPSIVTPSQTVP